MPELRSTESERGREEIPEKNATETEGHGSASGAEQSRGCTRKNEVWD